MAVHNKRKKIFAILLGTHSLLYFFISDFMLAYEIRSNFQTFNERRLASKSNVNGNEEFYFASCGEEFFREYEALKDFVENVSPTKQFSEEFHRRGFYRNVHIADPSLSVTDLISKAADNDDTTIWIIFNACRVSKFPFLYTKINQVEVFSDHTDFHAMMYNDQLVEADIHYVWILFKWFRIGKTYKGNHS